MNYVVCVAITFIVSVVLICQAEVEVRKDYVKAGYIIIDARAYRLTPVYP